ncbi:hypothetical protein F0L17_10170 [Streptomyces sp. TRM43335]|uniref:Lipoprotein n=1 Tax=Streptomyces taklimakanensis TaxID=2569853 RepID=A0A6G2BBP4_9ACTN|nr:hypothetical protein [Streptomyces taklimakanensis]MTE19483.1 hypothetical protein [Streptomyces taklimakanensis]
MRKILLFGFAVLFGCTAFLTAGADNSEAVSKAQATETAQEPSEDSGDANTWD